MFDEDFIPYDMGWDQIDIDAAVTQSNPNPAHDYLSLQAVATKPGYVYIYFTNEDDEIIEVYFDDLNIRHKRSPVVQADDYYPFGLTFNSYSKEKANAQDYLYTGKELQDELALGWVDYGARIYDPAIARWMAIDPMADLTRRWSAYTYVYNNPIRYIDPDGMYSTEEWKRDNGVTDNDLINVYTASDTEPDNPQQKDPGKSYVFYDPTPNSDKEGVDGGFPSQAREEVQRLEEKYGKGTVEMIPVTTEKEFAEGWKNMKGNINEVSLFFHGTAKTVNINYKNEEYLTILENEKTPNGASATRIQDLPAPHGNVSNAKLNLYSCKAANPQYTDNVATSFLMSTTFKTIIASPHSVSFTRPNIWFIFSYKQRAHKRRQRK